MADDGTAAVLMTTDPPRLEASELRVRLSSLFLTFLRLGLTAFGGPAMVAYIRDLAVKRKSWLSEESFRDGTALCQSIPGATAMQVAAYVGLRARGAAGALAAFLGFGLPAFVLMVVLSAVYEVSRNLQPVASGFRGLHVIVVALMANAVVTFGRSSIKNWRDAILACGAGTFLFFRGSPILAILASAAVGMVLYQGANLSLKPAHAADQPSGRRTIRPVLLGLLAISGGLAALFVTNRPLFGLATVMVKADLFAFGGGFASVPVMLHQVVDIRHWMDSKTFMDGIALGQVTPGPIVITATFVGYQIAGLLGAIVGTVAIFSPSFLMVVLTVPYFDRLQHALLFRRALRGILASFVGLLLAVTLQFAAAASWAAPSILLAVAAFVALCFLKIDILWVVLVGAAVSVIVL
jgi:chromate transporter